MQASDSVSLKGNFIMAMPGMSDPNFAQTVTCICEHNKHGAMGIVINRVHDALTGRDIFEELKIPCGARAGTAAVFNGGPVHVGELFVLHGPPFEWGACLRVTADLGLTNTRDILEAIGHDAGPESYFISLGCAGWGPGQLESELLENAWLTHPVFEDNIFKLPVEMRWEEAVRKLGINPSLLSDTAGHA